MNEKYPVYCFNVHTYINIYSLKSFSVKILFQVKCHTDQRIISAPNASQLKSIIEIGLQPRYKSKFQNSRLKKI